MADLDRKLKPGKPATARGRLRIGDDWNAITIIALSQSNPLKAIAERVENSIDANARTVTITRGREHGRHFLAIRYDGDGVPRCSTAFARYRARRSSGILPQSCATASGSRVCASA